jgi:DNA-binding MarR family transcriptional regulator
VKVFAMALREPRRMADLARQLRISRQAVQMSVKRLSELKVVELQPIPGNSRDKYVVITDRGRSARKAAEVQLRQMETEIRAVIGKEGEDTLRGLLVRLCEAFSPEEYVRGRSQVLPDSE